MGEADDSKPWNLGLELDSVPKAFCLASASISGADGVGADSAGCGRKRGRRFDPSTR